MKLSEAKQKIHAKEKQVEIRYNGPGAFATTSDGKAVIETPKGLSKQDEEKLLTQLFVSMDSEQGKGHDGLPVHSYDIFTRGKTLQRWIGTSEKSGADTISAIYTNYFLAVVCLVLTIVSYFINIYVAAIFAYLTGHFWSERLVGNSWGIEWFKGKSVVYTK